MYSIDFDSKVALVTGGLRGIGLASVKRFLDANCTVVINSRAPSDDTDIVISELQEKYPERVFVVYGSAADSSTIKELTKFIHSNF